MTQREKGLALLWLNDIVEEPERYRMFYSDSEQQLLAQYALEMLGEFECVDYVVTHKEYPIEEDDIYKTLCVGQYQKDGALSELDGDSIAQYNDKINECTGLYWIWKNTTSKYVGLSHYRRFFYRDMNDSDRIERLDKKRIKEILIDDDYDIILSLKLSLNWSVYRNMQQMVGEQFCEDGYDLFYDAIKEKQPGYLDAYVDMFNNNRMYACNMFVTRREILDEYCEWLFSFLLDVADKFDVSKGIDGQKRVVGYFAELMWTVWLAKQDLKIYELPIFQC